MGSDSMVQAQRTHSMVHRVKLPHKCRICKFVAKLSDQFCKCCATRTKMADDGMLVNFDVSGLHESLKPTFKGGKWKDRLSAKKSLRSNWDSSDRLNHNLSGISLHQDRQKATKRQRVQYDLAKDVEITEIHNNRTPAQKSNSKPSEYQVISSLFTSNPEVLANETGDTEWSEQIMEPSNAPLKDALETFTSLGLSRQLAEHSLKKFGIRSPTAIQRQAILQLCKNDNDAFIQAETGSGKTLAYLLPIIQRIMALPRTKDQLSRSSGLFSIILAPTRELCKQISVVLEALLTCSRWIVSGAVMGGEKKKSEKARLRKGLNILIATPGRLADHLDHTEVLNVNNVRWLVLDEGDRLMELGFEHDIERILKKLNDNNVRTTKISSLPFKRTTILCSATLKMGVQKLGELSLKKAVHIQSKIAAESTSDNSLAIETSFSAPAQLQQSYTIVPAKLRLVCLNALLKKTFDRRGSVMKAVVFMSCSDSVDFHFEVFAREHQDQKVISHTEAKSSIKINDIRTSVNMASFSSQTNPVRLFRLHGSLPQAVRTSTLAGLRSSKEPSVLICTDVASRGLDLPDIDFIIEYDPPFSKEDHLHRIGRTARAGKEGRASMFLMPGPEEGYVEILQSTRQDLGHHLLRQVAETLLRKGFETNGISNRHGWDQDATEWQLKIERWVLDNPNYLELARKAFQSHVRAYATHVASERKFFDLTTLHLGHLAKAFALRDKPGNLRTPQFRPNPSDKKSAQADRRIGATSGNTSAQAISRNEEDSSRKMRHKMKEHMSLASEFNIG